MAVKKKRKYTRRASNSLIPPAHYGAEMQKALVSDITRKMSKRDRAEEEAYHRGYADGGRRADEQYAAREGKALSDAMRLALNATDALSRFAEFIYDNRRGMK